MQNKNVSEFTLIIATAIVGIGSVWLSLQLFGDLDRVPSQEIQHEQQPTPGTSHQEKGVQGSENQREEIRALQQRLTEQERLIRSLQVSPPVELSETRALQQRLTEQERLIRSLQEQIAALEVAVAKPQPSPAEEIQTTVEKAEGYLKNETEKTWAQEQEAVLERLIQLYAIKGLTTQQNAALQDSITRMRQRKVNAIVIQAFQMDPQQAIHLLNETLKDKRLTPEQKNYLKNTLNQIQPLKSKDRSPPPRM